MNKFFSVILTPLLMLAVLSVAPSQARAGDFDDVAHVSLVPGWMRSDGFYMAAIQVDLKPGWKTYWRAPGNSGIPPEFDWSRSRNLEQVGYFWPSPRIMDVAGVRTIGYDKQLFLPIVLKPKDPALPIDLSLDMSFGVCEEVCVPAHGAAALSIAPQDQGARDAISASLAKRTKPATEMGLQQATCRIRPASGDYVISAEFVFDTPIAAHRVVVVETGSDLIWVSEADQTHQGKTLQVEADLMYFGDGTMALDRSNLRFTLLNDGASVEIAGCTGG